MPSCAIKWCGKCSNTSNYTKDGISFHRFPNDDIQKKEIWIKATHRKNFFPTKSSVICSRHFTQDCFESLKNRRRLYKSAVPTLYLPIINTNTDEAKTPEVIKVFCPKCKSEVSHTAEGIQMDQKDQLIAKVYHYFEQEYEELKRTIPGIEQSALAQLRQRTARATGVSETAVADVLAEEARRNEVRVKEEKRRSKEPLLVERKTRIRSMQDESSGEECNYYSSDEDNDERFEATETLVIKEEPLEPEYEEPAEPAFLNLPSVKQEPGSSEDPKELVDPIAINVKKEPGVKTEPNEEEATSSNGTPGATTSIKKRKIKTEAPPATSSSPTTSSPPKRRLIETKDIKVKMEKEEIKEEGNS